MKEIIQKLEVQSFTGMSIYVVGKINMDKVVKSITEIHHNRFVINFEDDSYVVLSGYFNFIATYVDR